MRPAVVWPSVAIIALLLGCGPSKLTVSGTDESGETLGGTESSGTESSGTESSGTESGGTEAGPAPVCGDGLVEGDEQCDDGNLVDRDGCSSICERELVLCDGHVYECGDGIDNDLDGVLDVDDTECVSPCDDSEGDLCDNLPQGSNDCTADCGFDANGGSGDDNCQLHLGCVPAPGWSGCSLPDPEAYPGCSAELEPECPGFCEPLLPNGCDCFGCCIVDGQGIFIDSFGYDALGSYRCCDLDALEFCWACEPRLDCFNPCEPEACELCFGQTIGDLDPGCSEPACPPGRSACASFHDCPEGWFCQTGCCIETRR